MHRHAVIDLDQQVAHLVQGAKLVDRAHQITLRAALDASARNVDVFVRQALDHIGGIQTELLQALLVDIDVYLVFQAAANLDGGDAGSRFETLLQFVIGETA